MARNLHKAQDLDISALATKADLTVETEKLRGEFAKNRVEIGKEIADSKVDILKYLFGTIGFQTLIIIGARRHAHQIGEALNHLPRALLGLDDFEDLLADAPEDERWELIAGHVVRMPTYTRWEHNCIITNLSAALVTRFRATRSHYRILTQTFRLKHEASSSSLLPDVIVYSPELPTGATFLTDATVIVEVMSKGTARRDREDKRAVYQTLPSLKHYMLVTRDNPHIETIDRIDGIWAGHRIADGLAATLALPGVGVEVPLAEVYADLFE